MSSPARTVAYVTSYDAADVRQWSGLGHYIARAIEDQGVNLEYIGPLAEKKGFLLDAKKKAYRRLGKRYLAERAPSVLKAYAAQVKARLRGSRAFSILSPGSLPLAYLDDARPFAFWSDATFASLVDYYAAFTGLAGETLRQGHAAERRALDRCALAIYSNDWAARSAVQDYGADPRKVKVVPFGANIECDRTASSIRRLAAERPEGVCRLLFVGRDWERKGGPLAVEVARALNAQGLPTELIVVGCQPPLLHAPPPWIRVIGYVAKDAPGGRETLDGVFGSAHLLILPSLAECAAVVLAEASSFGLPSLAADVGGNATLVRDGVNGHLFRPEDGAAEYSRYVADLMADRQRYLDLAASAFAEYERRLNWRTAGAAVASLLSKLG